MGKIRRRKLKGERYNPLIKVSQSVLAENVKQEIVMNLSLGHTGNQFHHKEKKEKKNKIPVSDKGGLRAMKEKITSINNEERLTGLNILAALALEENTADFLVKNRIIDSVIPLLKDSSSKIRLAATGSLRNLCHGGSDEVVDLMVDQNILLPLLQLLKECTNNEDGSSSNNASGFSCAIEDKDDVNLIFIHATNLLWNICECNEEAVKLCNEEMLSKILMDHINPQIWNYSVSLAAADCLLCISDNNSHVASSTLPQADTLVSLTFQALSDKNTSAALRFSVILSGILVNLNHWSPGSDSFRKVFEVLNRALEINPEEVKSRLIHTKATTKETEHVITAQLLAMEILSNICCPEEDEQWEECEEEMSDDEEIMDTGDQTEEKNVQVAVLEGIKYYDLANKVFEKISFGINDLPVNERTKDDVEKLRLLEIRSLQCYQNLVSILEIKDLGDADHLLHMWISLAKILFTNADGDSNFLEALTGVMRAIVDKLTLNKCQKWIDFDESELKQLFEVGRSCSVASVRANLARMVGTLARLLLDLSHPQKNFFASSAVVVAIIEYLIHVTRSDEELFVQAEALDSLIDIFSDDKTDLIAYEVHLLARLKEIQPEFKAKHNKLRKKLGDHRPLIITVRDNLIAFIKYKGQRISKLSASNSSLESDSMQ